MEIIIPELGQNVEQAEILALLVSVGEHVRALQPVLELEADKASFELPSPAAGRIEHIYVGIGDDVKVGDLVLVLRPAEPEPLEQTEIDGQQWRSLPYIRASPVARGRVRGLGVVREWPRIQHAAIHDALDVTWLEAARCRYRDEHDAYVQLTLTAFVIKACAIALRQHPRMNSSLIRDGRALAIKRFIHVGVAVQTELGLIYPVIEHADRRPLRDIAVDLEALTAKAQSNSLVHEQLEGATFRVTNLRGFSGTKFTPIVDPPQVGALGFCRTRTEGSRTLLPVSLAHDQRVNDAAAATAFLATIAELLHDPLAMLLRA